MVDTSTTSSGTDKPDEEAAERKAAEAGKGKGAESGQEVAGAEHAEHASAAAEAQANTVPVKKQARKSRATGSEAKATKAETESKIGKLLFGKYSLDDVVISDQSLANYMTFQNKEYPNIFGRRKYNSYYSTHISIIERFVNKLMRGGTGKKVGGVVIRTEGRLQGKKIKVMHVVEEAFDIIYSRTKQNPIQVFVNAIEHSVPIEDTTRVRYGGITYNVAVDISSTRRINVTLKNLALASITKAFQNKKKLADSIADEIILAASGSPESYAIKRKAEMARMARSAR